jgi:hypothetical protein
MRHLALVLALTVFGCAQAAAPGIPAAAIGNHLVVVTSEAWMEAIGPYVTMKVEQGWHVSIMTAENEQDTLAADLAAVGADYAFLVGDYARIPTVFQCTVIDWSPTYGRSCIYSDYWLGVDATGTRRTVVGRLITNGVDDIIAYTSKAAVYAARVPTHTAYAISDRNYDPTDRVALDEVATLNAYRVAAHLDIVGRDAYPILNDGTGDATVATLAAAFGSDDVVTYYGHGSADFWGYEHNINWRDVAPQGTPIPTVMAIGCETARSAPNPPWYPYESTAGTTTKLAADQFWAEDQIPDPMPTQPEALLNTSFGSALVNGVAGPMTYVGETVVTTSRPGLLYDFTTALAHSYTHPSPIGLIWAQVADGYSDPEFWQFIGDPTTVFATN